MKDDKKELPVIKCISKGYLIGIFVPIHRDSNLLRRIK